MRRVTPPPPSPFDQRWITEAVRLRETHAGALEDSAAVRHARAVGGGFEARVIARAVALAQPPDGLLDAWHRWHGHATLAWAAMVVGAALTGAGIAAGVLGSGVRTVNVVWALGGLLGVHLVTLALWFLTLLLSRSHRSSLAGRTWIGIAGWFGRRHGEAWLPQALIGITGQRGAMPAWLGRISHGLWLIALVCALVTLLVMLSTRRYGFVWETTILPADAFIRLTEALAWLPRLAGLQMPDADMVLRAAGPEAVEADRRIWSAWLVSALVLYGILPRLLLWLVCDWRWRALRKNFRLDLTQPAYARLKPRLMPASEHAGVNDAAPAQLPAFHTGHGAAVAGNTRCAVALELGTDIGWPPDTLSAAHNGGRLDAREERRRTLDALSRQPVERLLVAIDPRLSPDRGTLALIAELSRYAHACAVWLAAAGTPERRGHWHDALHQLGIDADHQFDTIATACHWLERNDD